MDGVPDYTGHRRVVLNDEDKQRELLNSDELPRDAKVMALILKSMGVDEFEPKVIHQMLEFMNRSGGLSLSPASIETYVKNPFIASLGYVTDILQDAEKYKEHAGKSGLDISDIRMAIQSRVNHSFIQPPPRQTMLEMARKKNSIPITEMPEQFGVLLPPEDWCLTSVNFQLEPRNAMADAAEDEEITANPVDLNAPLTLQPPTLPPVEQKPVI